MNWARLLKRIFDSVIDKDLNVRNGAYRMAGTGRVRPYPRVASGRSIRLFHLRPLTFILQPLVALIANGG